VIHVGKQLQEGFKGVMFIGTTKNEQCLGENNAQRND
jgi:hypothetical protein